jgi:hypothetical protein
LNLLGYLSDPLPAVRLFYLCWFEA